ncbi:MAG: TIGR01440 family protein [Candidatus Methanofastidiosa archaeon]|nr:TIGR01440 family protein [Candidatus Methanofastidiosa archaeon]
MDLSLIKQQTFMIIDQLLKISKLTSNDIFILGCSTSAVLGYKIGKRPSGQIAECIFETVYPVLKNVNIYLAVQCCEHLNRAIVVEQDLVKQYGLEQVNVIPEKNAGGSLAAHAFKHMYNAVVVEYIQAHAGIDIGGTMIGMHLKPVVIPIHFEENKIGQATVICARTRPKYIGGDRAKYTQIKNE